MVIFQRNTKIKPYYCINEVYYHNLEHMIKFKFPLEMYFFNLKLGVQFFSLTGFMVSKLS
jgi:hypothetical protein